MDEEIERHRIADAVPHESAAVTFLEQMFVNPEPVRAAKLFVHKSRRRFPGGDFRPPSNRETVNAEPMIDQRPGAHLDRSRRDRPKFHPWWCDRVEVRGVRKETKHLFARARQ